MADLVDDATILNRALARIGAGAVTGRDEDTDLARQAWAVYDDTVEAGLALYHWKWPLRTVRLDRLAGEPGNGWDYAFQAPSTALGPPQALFSYPRTPQHPLRDFQVEGGTVYADVADLWGRYVVRLAAAEWPPLYRVALTMWLAAELAVPVTHDSTLASALRQEVFGSPSEAGRGGLMGRAIALDTAGSGDPSPILASDPLTGARFDGPWWG